MTAVRLDLDDRQSHQLRQVKVDNASKFDGMMPPNGQAVGRDRKWQHHPAYRYGRRSLRN